MKNRFSSYIKLSGIIFSLIVTFVMIVMNIPEEIEIIAEDTLYQKAKVIPSDVKIIAIDEITLKDLGPYNEWDRGFFADLIETLNSDENTAPKVIGFDVIFSGTNNSSGEKRLSEAIKNSGNIVLASKLETDSRIMKSENGEYFIDYYISEEVTAYDEISSSADSGFTNAILDDDGYVRRYYTVISSGDKSYKGFSYAVAEKAFGKDALSHLAPIVEIGYSGNPGDYEIIPMSKVLDGSVPSGYFKDCIVLVGAYEEGMRDSYRVPIFRSGEMYGVECQANAITAFSENLIIKKSPLWAELVIAIAVLILSGYVMMKKKTKGSVVVLFGVVILYPLLSLAVFEILSVKLSLIYVPIGAGIQFLTFLLIRYIELQKKRADEMQKMLFSMADSMAEAIEGRTPYNANHTKNVAKRCMEMLDYINKMHKEKRTEMHFSKKDKNQLYLAAMLHDIGKMDVPVEVMDKPTKLGAIEEKLLSRLEIISLKIRNDILSGRVTKEEGEEKISHIEEFISNLGEYNCGRPLKEDELEFIDEFSSMVYVSENGEEIPYLTEEETNDLHIEAGTLSEEERKIMQGHVLYTDKILNHMHFGEDFSDVRAMASNHHELLNSKGYPKGIGEENLDVMTRILTIMDIYDSLIADDRPYKKAKPNDIAFKILDDEAKAGKIDSELLKIAKEIWLD